MLRCRVREIKIVRKQFWKKSLRHLSLLSYVLSLLSYVLSLLSYVLSLLSYVLSLLSYVSGQFIIEYIIFSPKVYDSRYSQTHTKCILAQLLAPQAFIASWWLYEYYMYIQHFTVFGHSRTCIPFIYNKLLPWKFHRYLRFNIHAYLHLWTIIQKRDFNYYNYILVV